MSPNAADGEVDGYDYRAPLAWLCGRGGYDLAVGLQSARDMGGGTMKRIFLLSLLLVVPVVGISQVQSAAGKGVRRMEAGPRAAHNSAANDTTPLNCSRDEVRFNPHPGVRLLCERWERRLLQEESRRAGRPAPSSSVVVLPPLGSSEAKRLGFVCIGGQAFERLPNGWSQLMAPEGGWQRCEGG